MNPDYLEYELRQLRDRIAALESRFLCPSCGKNEAGPEHECAGDWQETGKTFRCCNDCRYDCGQSV